MAKVVLTEKQHIPLGNIQLARTPVKIAIRDGFAVMQEAAPAYYSVYACRTAVNPLSTSATTWQCSAMLA